jgi:hypothetical protein
MQGAGTTLRPPVPFQMQLQIAALNGQSRDSMQCIPLLYLTRRGLPFAYQAPRARASSARHVGSWPRRSAWRYITL